MDDILLLDAGITHLSEKLGILDTERFITLILRRQSFDYTKWREKNLFIGMSVKEISQAAQEYCDAFPEE
jgi:hypothetical protein